MMLAALLALASRCARGGQADHHRHLRAERAVPVGRRSLHLRQSAGAAGDLGGRRAGGGQGVRARGRSRDRHQGNKQVDFAVIDGVYLAERGVPYAVLATATSGGDTAPRWALFSGTVDQGRRAAGQEAEHGVVGLARRRVRRRTRCSTASCRSESSSPAQTKAPDIAAAVAAVLAAQGRRGVRARVRGQGAEEAVRGARSRAQRRLLRGRLGAVARSASTRSRRRCSAHGAAGPGSTAGSRRRRSRIARSPAAWARARGAR